jgi:hypothetical protein
MSLRSRRPFTRSHRATTRISSPGNSTTAVVTAASVYNPCKHQNFTRTSLVRSKPLLVRLESFFAVYSTLESLLLSTFGARTLPFKRAQSQPGIKENPGSLQVLSALGLLAFPYHARTMLAGMSPASGMQCDSQRSENCATVIQLVAWMSCPIPSRFIQLSLYHSDMSGLWEGFGPSFMLGCRGDRRGKL